MNFMRQAQVSAMVCNASGQSEVMNFGRAPVTVNTVHTLNPVLDPALVQAVESAFRSQKEFLASVARHSAGSMLDVTRLEDAAPRLMKPKRSTNCKPALSGLTTEAPAGRYQGLGFREGE